MKSTAEKKNTITDTDSKSNYESKIENFNSEFYFDDIIKELSDAGFYSNDGKLEKNKNEKLVIDKNFFNDAEEQNKLHKGDGILSFDIKEKERALDPNSTLDSDFKNEIFGRLNRINNKIDNQVRKYNQSIEDIKEMLEINRNTANDAFSEVFSRLLISNSENEENFNNLFSTFSNKIDNDKTKDVAFEKIYEQMEFYKKDLMLSLTKPFIKDLILFYDRINTNISHFNNVESENQIGDKEEKRNFIGILDNFKDEIVEILKRNGIERKPKSKVGEIFDPKLSSALEQIKIEDSSIQNLSVKEVLQEGFLMDGKVIRHESVIIYKK